LSGFLCEPWVKKSRLSQGATPDRHGRRRGWMDRPHSKRPERFPVRASHLNAFLNVRELTNNRRRRQRLRLERPTTIISASTLSSFIAHARKRRGGPGCSPGWSNLGRAVAPNFPVQGTEVWLAHYQRATLAKRDFGLSQETRGSSGASYSLFLFCRKPASRSPFPCRRILGRRFLAILRARSAGGQVDHPHPVGTQMAGTDRFRHQPADNRAAAVAALGKCVDREPAARGICPIAATVATNLETRPVQSEAQSHQARPRNAGGGLSRSPADMACRLVSERRRLRSRM
jgi:hypothetical protein